MCALLAIALDLHAHRLNVTTWRRRTSTVEPLV